MQETSLPLDRLAGFAKEYLRDFKILIHVPQLPQQVATRKWSPPPSATLKTNFDGAMFGQLDEVGIGIVIRNSEGKVMAAFTEKIQKPSSVEILELLAVRHAFLFSAETRFSSSIFEGDSESVVKSLQGWGLENSQGGHIIKDILSYANFFQSFSFSHVVR